MRVGLDTNVLLQMPGRRQPFRPILDALTDGHPALAVSTEILLEYEEVALQLAGAQQWRNVELLLQRIASTHGNVVVVAPGFRFRLIATDPDDNKFADCAIAAAADFIITDDAHFEAVRAARVKPQPISPADFIATVLPKLRDQPRHAF